MKVTNAEYQIMKILWVNDGLTSKEIHDYAEGSSSWKISTVKTLIGRLVEKGYIKATKEGSKHIYSYIKTENDSVRQAVDEVIERICAAKVKDVIEGLIEKGKFSEMDISELRNLVDKKEFENVAIECDCLEKGEKGNEQRKI